MKPVLTEEEVAKMRKEGITYLSVTDMVFIVALMFVKM